jgi:hypothetical protein
MGAAPDAYRPERTRKEAITDIPRAFLNSVAFVGFQDKETHELRLGGTVFFLTHRAASKNTQGFFDHGYIVTAAHNLDAIAKHSFDAVIRVNLKTGGNGTLTTRIADWVRHLTDSSVDVAVYPIRIWVEEYDHSFFAIEQRVNQHLSTESVDIGDELFFPGLFIHHYGTEHNIPIVRLGNIVAMPEEKVRTIFGGRERPIDAYLGEVRSIGGLSGSPVFVSMIGRRKGANIISHPTPYRLLGLIHGHFDRSSTPDVVATDSEAFAEKVNMGIALIVPAEKIVEVLESPQIQAHELAVDSTFSA